MTAEIQATQTFSPVITDSEPGEFSDLSAINQERKLSTTDYLASQYDPALLLMPRVSDPAAQLMQGLLSQMSAMIQSLFSLVNSLVERLIASKPPTTTPPPQTNTAPTTTTGGTTTTPTTGTQTPPTTGTTTPTQTNPAPECKCDTPTTPKTTPKISTPLGGSGFLWKPVSEKDGKLVVLLPSKFKGKVQALKLTDSKGTTLATGSYSGIGNGDREHFRFPKAGDAYPDGVRVVVKLNDNSTRYVTIKETSQRYQR